MRSCCQAGGRTGGRPACSVIRADAVCTSESAGERAVLAAIWSRGGPRPAIASRSISANAPCRYGDAAENRSAPIPPNAPPSVERKTSVCVGRTGAGAEGLAIGACAYDRASSISARRPRGVVVRACAGPEVVAVRRDDDLVLRLAGHDRDEVLELARPHSRNRRAEALDLGGEPVRRELSLVPVRRLRGALGSGRAVGVVRRQLLSELERGVRVERGRKGRRRQRHGPGDGEGGQEQGQAHEQPGAAVEASVDGALEGAAPRPAAP